MAHTEKRPGKRTLLRQRAEEALAGKRVAVDDLSSTDIEYLLHELQVHQAELAIQNAELRETQLQVEVSRDRYADLYNFAPAGYCTVNRKDRILEANQTLAAMLGFHQQALVHQPFTRFVAQDDQDIYYLHRRRAFEKRQNQSSEIRLVKQPGEYLHVRMESKISQEDDNRLMIMLIDITKQRELQNRLVEQREKERQQISHYLHDGPIQALSAITFKLRAVLMDYSQAALAQALEEIQANLREQIQALRDFSVELRPPILAHLGVELALRSYIESFGENHPDLRIRLALHPVGSLISDNACAALFRIGQEALRNVSKHALGTATEVTVRLDKNDRHVFLEIHDNGAGFDLPEEMFHFAQRGHLGIIGMHELAEAVGGHLVIQSSNQQGTLVKAVVPIQNSPVK